MKILLAEDDALTRLSVEAALADWGFQAVSYGDGTSAWGALQQPDAPRLALMDWLMPGLDGIEICRRCRATPALSANYLIVLTARDTKADVIVGLQAGADDYVSKPFDREELRLRLRAGQRILELQKSLADRVTDLEDALARVKQLEGIIPICAYCKKIRSDRHYWQQVEAYLQAHIDVRFSHGICPECYETKVKPQMHKMKRDLPPYPPASG
jgi:CheY-like chemotaxis protein